MDEFWKTVVGFEATHEVSNIGRVRTIARTYVGGRERLAGGQSTIGVKQRVRPTYLNHRGYRVVALCCNRLSNVRLIHRLVAEAFIGPAPTSAHQVNHIDGDKANNCMSNLEWVTPSENLQHAYDTGLHQPMRGTDFPTAKLDDSKVREIRKMLTAGASQRSIGRLFGVPHQRIGAIAQGKAWRHVD